MGALAEVYFTKDKLKTLLDVVEKKQEKGVALTISINDETNQYGQNVTCFVAQSKEQREEKKEKFYTGNGKVFWTNGTIKTADKQEPQLENNSGMGTDDDGVPF